MSTRWSSRNAGGGARRPGGLRCRRRRRRPSSRSSPALPESTEWSSRRVADVNVNNPTDWAGRSRFPTGSCGGSDLGAAVRSTPTIEHVSQGNRAHVVSGAGEVRWFSRVCSRNPRTALPRCASRAGAPRAAGGARSDRFAFALSHLLLRRGPDCRWSTDVSSKKNSRPLSI